MRHSREFDRVVWLGDIPEGSPYVKTPWSGGEELEAGTWISVRQPAESERPPAANSSGESYQIFAELSEILQTLLSAPDQFELVLGIGCLSWLPSSGSELMRHVLAFPLALEFDHETEAFRLGPAGEDTSFAIETEFVDTESPALELLTDRLAGQDVDPGNRELLDQVLTEFARALGPGGRYDPGFGVCTVPDEYPRVTFSPALILRQCAAGRVEEWCAEIINRLKESAEAPSSLARLLNPLMASQRPDVSPGEVDGLPKDTDGLPEDVDDSPQDVDDSPEDADDSPEDADDSPEDADDPPEDVDDSPEDVDDSPEDADDSPEDVDASVETRQVDQADHSDERPIYLPLPSSSDQQKVAERAAAGEALVVHGPTGTGKSHAIVNLLCHLLAEGKRVLVTAADSAPLAGLHELIPDRCKPFCTLTLGEEQTPADGLQQGLELLAEWALRDDVESHAIQMDQCRSQLRVLRKQQEKIDRQLVDLRKREADEYSVAEGAYRGSIQSIIWQVQDARDRFGWFEDEVQTDQTLPFSAKDLLHLLELHRQASDAEVDELSKLWPTTGELPSVEGLRQQAERERQTDLEQQQAERELKEAKQGADDAVWKSLWERQLDPDRVERFHHRANEFHYQNDQLQQEEDQPEWLRIAARDILDGGGEPWFELVEKAAEVVKKLAKSMEKLEETPVIYSGNIPLDKLESDAEDLQDWLVRKRNLGGLWPIISAKARRLRRLVRSVQVGGEPCEDVPSVELLLESIRNHKVVDKVCKEKWAKYIDCVDGTLPEQFKELRSIVEVSSTLAEIRDTAKSLSKEIEELQLPGTTSLRWGDQGAVQSILDACELYVARRRERRDVRAEFDGRLAALEDILRQDNVHPIAGAILRVIRDRDVDAYGRQLAVLQELNEKKKRQEELRQSQEKLTKVAPRLADRVGRTAEDPMWEQRFRELPDAWQWARAKSWTKKLLQKQGPESLHEQHQAIEDECLRCAEEFAAAAAAKHTADRWDDTLRWNLAAGSRAIRNLTETTSTGEAQLLRQEARRLLTDGVRLLPAWIAPMELVFELTSPHVAMFDVVIIDDASRCGLDSLLLLFLAEQVIVVGDDEQPNPDCLVNRQSFQRLKNEHLIEAPIAGFLRPTTDLLDLAHVLCRRSLSLHEHFRCVPEIIQFNRKLLDSDTTPTPLRRAALSSLEPLCECFVPDGRVESVDGGHVNPTEANELTDQVVRCCSDPRYEGKTIGVISLLGGAQAELIQRRLVERLGTAEIKHRRLLCGEPLDFRGHQRDVVFLSMVAAGPARSTDAAAVRPLTGEMPRRALNVATSHARDQLWLFYSVSVDELAVDDELRRELVHSCQNPPVESIGFHGQSDLGLPPPIARHSEAPAAPFSSWLEADLFQRLADAGFGVAVQHPTPLSGYRCDLMVAGKNAQLVVECEGDRWEGEDNFRRELRCQRRLEQAGWSFRRVQSSRYYDDPNRALSELWTSLRELGIRPLEVQPASDLGEGIGWELELPPLADSDNRGEVDDGDSASVVTAPDPTVGLADTQIPDAATKPKPETSIEQSPAEQSDRDVQLGRLVKTLTGFSAGFSLDDEGQVTVVDLRGTPASDQWLSALAGIPSLKELYLPIQTSDEGVRQLDDLDQLEKLYLNCTRVTDDGMAHLERFRGLKCLNLCYTRTTDRCVEHLERLTNLEKVDLRGTDITGEGAERLGKALEHCILQHVCRVSRQRTDASSAQEPAGVT